MRGWKDLGVVETIYEEEHEDYSSSYSPSISSSLTASPLSPLQSLIERWSLETGLQADVLIHVQDQCFQLHKGPLITRSRYLKRYLTESSDINLTPPLKLTAETFSAIVEFCYGSQIVITPFNVAALRIAAELLDMTEEDDEDDGNLKRKTETYFCQAVSVNCEYATIVLRSCLALLPESEGRVSLVTRCIEALGLIDGIGGVNGWMDEITALTAEEFQMIAYSMHGRFTRDHDLLYTIVDLYLVEKTGKMTEEEKTLICNSVDCNKLSPQLLIHAVQNPRLPLRFIVRAMLVEQLNTRRSIFSTAAASTSASIAIKVKTNQNNQPITLGAILQRDAALRQVAQMKASMDATTSKIQTLERDLMDMKELLRESERKREALQSGRSESFRFSTESRNLIGRGERGSISFSFSDRREKENVLSSCTSSEKSSSNGNSKTDKRLGWRLINGLKTAFRLSSSSSKMESESRVSSKVDGNKDMDEDGIGTVIQDDCRPSHRRSRSFV